MANDKSQLAVEAHLAEYGSLRQEMLEMIKWKDQLVFLSLGISGTLLSFSLSADQPSNPWASRHLALYLVTPLAAALGGLWEVNSMRTHRIGIYIRDILAPKLNDLLREGGTTRAASLEVFAWESSSQRVMHKWSRRLLEWLVLFSAFVATGAVAQYLIIIGKPGGLTTRIFAVESPPFFLVNCGVLLLSLLLFVRHLWFGRKNTGSSAVSLP